jgi:hypothetical protein
MEANLHFENVTARDSAILEGPTSVTHGPVEALAWGVIPTCGTAGGARPFTVVRRPVIV